MRRLARDLALMVGSIRRERSCRRAGHAWTDASDPISCCRCGMARTYGRWW